MTSLREIVQLRARVPAKIHAMEAGPVSDRAPPTAPAPSGGPLIVQYHASQGGPTPGEAVATSGPRPPRPGVSASPGASPQLRKASEGRKPQPRSGSEPGRRIASARSGGNQSAAGHGTSEDTGDGQPPVARAKARSSSVRARIGDAAPPVDRNDVGKVPAYLRRRQEEMAEQKRRAARPASPVAPPGYRKVADAEKQATVAVLRQRKSEVEVQQRKLPFTIETAGQKQREKDLSDRVAHLDKLLGMFGQPVVFIPADASPIATIPPPPSPQVTSANGRPPRIREDGPAVSETSHESQASRQPRGRSGGEQEVVAGAPRPSNQELAAELAARQAEMAARQGEMAARQANNENHARANAIRQRQYAEPPPWDARSDVSSNVRTGVKVMAPPGGICTLSLAYD